MKPNSIQMTNDVRLCLFFEAESEYMEDSGLF